MASSIEKKEVPFSELSPMCKVLYVIIATALVGFTVVMLAYAATALAPLVFIGAAMSMK